MIKTNILTIPLENNNEEYDDDNDFFFFFTLECRQVGLEVKSRPENCDPEHTRLDGSLSANVDFANVVQLLSDIFLIRSGFIMAKLG